MALTFSVTADRSLVRLHTASPAPRPLTPDAQREIDLVQAIARDAQLVPITVDTDRGVLAVVYIPEAA